MLCAMHSAMKHWYALAGAISLMIVAVAMAAPSTFTTAASLGRSERVVEAVAAGNARNAEVVRALEALLVSGDDLSAFSLRLLTRSELAVLRQTIYARHGKRFDDLALQSYFDRKAWYREDPDYTDDSLTMEDRRNIAAILCVEGDVELAHWQEALALSKQTDDIVEAAERLDVLNAYLTDRSAFLSGDAEPDFRQPALEFYLDRKITEPLTGVVIDTE